MSDTDRAADVAPAGFGRTVLNALWPVLVSAVLGFVMLKFVAPQLGGYRTNLAIVIGINIMLAVSLTVVNGLAGQFSLGHAGFMAIGGYVAATIVYYGSMLLWDSAHFAGGWLSYVGIREFDGPPLAAGDALFVVACLVGGLAAAIAGYVVGLPSLRLRGDYLAIVTLGFGEIVRVLLQGTSDQIPPWEADRIHDYALWELPLMVGGPKGFNLLPGYTTVFWSTLGASLTLILIYRLKFSAIGREFLSVRNDEIAAQAMGVNVTRAKVRAFVISAFFAGVAGGLFAMQLSAINATELGFQKSIDIVIMVVLGGMGSISGATLAAALLSILPELLRDPPAVWPAGVVLLVLMAIAQRRRGRWSPRSFAFVAVATVVLEVGRRLAIDHGIELAKYRLVIYALMLILMMLLRPDGLFGMQEFWDFLPRRRRRSTGGSTT